MTGCDAISAEQTGGKQAFISMPNGSQKRSCRCRVSASGFSAAYANNVYSQLRYGLHDGHCTVVLNTDHLLIFNRVADADPVCCCWRT